MSKDTKNLNIYQRINAVMAEIDYIQKNDKAAKGLPYKFVSHDQVTGKLHGPLTKHGIVVLPSVEQLTQDGNRTTINVRVDFVNIDVPEDRFSVNYVGYGIDPQDKGPGKALSYAVKYALLKVFCLETGDDVERGNEDYRPGIISESQLQEIELLINGHDDIRKTIAKHVPKGDLSKLETNRFEAVVKYINNLIAKKEAA